MGKKAHGTNDADNQILINKCSKVKSFDGEKKWVNIPSFKVAEKISKVADDIIAKLKPKNCNRGMLSKLIFEQVIYGVDHGILEQIENIKKEFQTQNQTGHGLDQIGGGNG